MIKKASIMCLTLGLAMLAGNGIYAQELFGVEGEAEGSAEAGGEAEAANATSPLDAAEQEPAKEEPAEDKGAGGGGPGSLLLTRHTMQAGGEISISPHVYIPDAGDSEGGGTFTFSPYLGYFVIDHLEVLFAFNLWLPFGDTVGTLSVALGFGVGARYIFDFDVICLYVGGMFGPSFVIPDNERADVIKYFNISMPVGILVPLNYHVGLNVGMRFNFDIHLGDDPPGSTVISFPIGYFGVEGFFNLFAD